MMIDDDLLEKNFLLNVGEFLDTLREVLEEEELEYIFNKLSIEEKAKASSNGNSFRK